MLELKHSYKVTNDKIIERIIDDDNVAINHMVLNEGESLPQHYSNSNVYMIVVRGAVSLTLGEQDEHTYGAGSIVQIPYNTKMDVKNNDDATLEFFVVKSPSPSTYARILQEK